MSIKGKFFLLSIINTTSFLIIGAIYILTTSPINKIENEKEVLLDYERVLYEVQQEMNKIAINRVESQYRQYQNKNQEAEELALRLTELNYLPQANQQIAESLEIIINLQKLNSQSLSDMDEKIQLILVDAERVFSFTNTFTISELSSQDYEDRTLRTEIYNHLDLFYTQLSSMNNDYSSFIENIQSQYEEIEKEIGSIRQRSYIIAVSFMILVILISILLSRLVAVGIIRNMDKIVLFMDHVSDGDLTTTVDIRSNDEIGKLADNISYMIHQKLQSTIQEIKVSSDSNLQIKDLLLDHSDSTLTSVREIFDVIGQIDEMINRFGGEFTGISEKIDRITHNVEHVDDQIGNQSASVEEASASIEEMFNSIQNISSLSRQRKENAESLLESSEKGKETIGRMHAIMDRISAKVEDISALIHIINDTAEQTNLLSMNAAIEAANAGSQGAGFGVVAGEIRKLAATSGKNATEISSVLNSMIEGIKEAAAASLETRDTFSMIHREIADVTDVLSEILSSTMELTQGSKEILLSMDSLNQITLDVKSDSADIRDGTENIQKSINSSRDDFVKVLQGVKGIFTTIETIEIRMKEVNDLSVKMSDVSEKLEDQVNQFKTE